MSIPSIIYITLQQIIIYAQEQKEIQLRGGRALPEKILSDKPVMNDYLADDTPITPPPTPIHTPQLEHKPMSLLERVKAMDSNQITLEEAVSKSLPPSSDAAASPPPIAASPPPVPVQAPSAQADTANDDEPISKSLFSRIRHYFQDKRDWRLEKWRSEYEYQQLRKQVNDACTGYDDIIEYCKQLIKDWEKKEQDIEESRVRMAMTTPAPDVQHPET